jgi:spermidine synthase
VKPNRILDCVTTPDGGEIVLYQRGDAFEIQVDSYDLMSSRAHGSEEEMARLALAALGDRPAPGILIGGLGMGFTLRATLDALAPRAKARVEVAEVFPAVLDWNRRFLGALAGHPLNDPRVQVILQDVATLLTPGTYDAILLDVDNGAQAFTLERNRHLYTRAGIARLHRALTPRGVAAIWSTTPDPAFADRLQREGFRVTAHRISARPGGKGGKHTIFLARN